MYYNVKELRNMYTEGENDSYPQDVVILPLSPIEIESLIAKENNPTVAASLRAYVKGRDSYFYNSHDDKYFTCEVVKQHQEEKTGTTHK